MKTKAQLKDIVSYSKGYQINGDELLDDGKYDYLNGGVLPSGKWNEYNTEAETITVSEGGNSCGFVNYMQKPFWCGAHCYYLYDSKVNTKYLYYILKSQQDRLMKLRSGACMPNIKKSDLGKFEVIYDTDSNEQQKVIDVLDRISSIITARQQELQKFDELIKARFVEMFNCCDLAEQKEDWKPISKIGTIISGSTPKTKIAEYWDGEYRWITPAEIDNEAGYIYDSQRKITLDGAKSCSLTELPIDTVLLTSRAPIGKVALAGNTFFCNQGFKNIVCNNRINPLFLYTLLRLNTDYLNSLGRGATFKEISKKIVENIKIPVPSMDLQNQFATFVKQIDKSKVAVKNALDKTQ